jgi:hypothetical protein
METNKKLQISNESHQTKQTKKSSTNQESKQKCKNKTDYSNLLNKINREEKNNETKFTEQKYICLSIHTIKAASSNPEIETPT